MWKKCFTLLVTTIVCANGQLFPFNFSYVFPQNFPTLPSIQNLPTLPSIQNVPTFPSIQNLTFPSFGNGSNLPKFQVWPGVEIDFNDFSMPIHVKNPPADVTARFGVFNTASEDADKIKFTLYTSKTNYTPEDLSLKEDDSFSKSSWDKSQKTKIIIHGYSEDNGRGLFAPTMQILKAYTKAKRPENIVFVDWRRLSSQPIYYNSAGNTGKVGQRVSEFIIYLKNNSYISTLQDVHIVGFSLGAHVAGIAATAADDTLEEKIGRISGLDPAGPGFSEVNVSDRLDSSDANFVDVIHTNMGDSITTLGTMFKTGHVDFYPNGGEHQPGCVVPLFGEPFGICSHVKAADYFANSISGTKYKGCPCSDWKTFKKGSCDCKTGALMGEFLDPKTPPGEYYLNIPNGQ